MKHNPACTRLSCLLHSPFRRFISAALLGAAGVLCFAPAEFFWLAPLVWGGLFALLRRAETSRQATLTGFGFGLGFFLTGVSWVYVSLSVFGGMPWWLAGLAALLFCTAMALYPALAGGLFKRWQPAGFLEQAIFFAALITAVDWLRSWFLTGFPWLGIGYSQAPPSPLAGFAPIIGVHGLALLLALNGALLLRWRIGLTALAATCIIGLGLRQIEWTQPEGKPLSVALIQGNVPQEMKFRPEAFYRTLSLYRQLITQHPAQLTLLPETALPVFFEQLPESYLLELERLASRRGGDLLAGTLTGNQLGYYNSAVSLGSSAAQVYSKQHLVPFGEFIPTGFAWFMAYAQIPMSAFSRGSTVPEPLRLAGHTVAVNICYEDAFGREIAPVAGQAGVLANLSNTAWFGHSLAQPQHLQISQMRALETGRPMLRATNTGMTAIIAADGNVTAVLPAFESGVLEGEVQPRTGQTPYIVFGDWPALLLMALGLAFGLICGKRQATAVDG